MSNAKEVVANVLEGIRQRDPDQKEFFQAAEEILESLVPLLEKNPRYLQVLPALVEPERVIHFRVPWQDDKGVHHVNRGFRVQFNSAIGPYKGGLRFHPSVNLSIVKFLGFEQILKNSLTTLPMGGGKGGSDFNPKGKSDSEVLRFCQSFMLELFRHIGPNTDVPAGDIGVGGREIGYLFGQYRRICNDFTGVLTGKGIQWGGSLIRPEATGYGLVYYTKLVIEDLLKKDLKGKRVAVSGSGNVAQYCIEKLLEFGAIPISCSDSSGTIVEENGITAEGLKFIMDLKNVKRGRIHEYSNFSKSAKFLKGEKPWKNVKCDIALPCATQNEVDGSDVDALKSSGCYLLCEGSNMSSTNEAIAKYKSHGITYGPAKAANAGGVAVSGLEMTQNSNRLGWTREEVDEKLQRIMRDIYNASMTAANDLGQPGDLQMGANAAGFLKVAEAMLNQGHVINSNL